MSPAPLAVVVTLWCVTAANPEAVIAAKPHADRGFGRKLLSQVNPRWVPTPIGQFSLNRSITAGVDEFYIAGFPGLTIIQTTVPDCRSLSNLDPRLLSVIPAADVYAFALGAEAPLAGYAHWRGGQVKRSWLATDTRTWEDMGPRQDWEENPAPFDQDAVVRRAQKAWLGFDPADAPDINVVAYAVDGRPEPKYAATPPQRQATSPPLAQAPVRDYDDYENQAAYDTEQQAQLPAVRTALRIISGTAQAVRGRAGRALRRADLARQHVVDKLRYSDRPPSTDEDA